MFSRQGKGPYMVKDFINGTEGQIVKLPEVCRVYTVYVTVCTDAQEHLLVHPHVSL